MVLIDGLVLLDTCLTRILSARSEDEFNSYFVWTIPNFWNIYNCACNGRTDDFLWQISNEMFSCVIPSFRFTGKVYVIIRSSRKVANSEVIAALLYVDSEKSTFLPAFEDFSRNNFNTVYRMTKSDCLLDNDAYFVDKAKNLLDRASVAVDSVPGTRKHKRYIQFITTPNSADFIPTSRTKDVPA
jgi:hypothetical protein